MSLFEWVQFLYSVCTSGYTPTNWQEVAFFSNIAIAIAYFWIPLVMFAVFRRKRQDIPFPWLWSGFVIFIGACGTSHLVHALHTTTELTPYGAGELLVLFFTAVASVATAAGFTFLLPKIMAMASPKAGRERLEAAVNTATQSLERALLHEKVLLRELHHRVKNNLQISASLINLQANRTDENVAPELQALRDRIRAMADVHDQFDAHGAGAFSVAVFLSTLCDRLKAASARDDVVCLIEGNDFTVSLDEATPLALILNEVVTNAFEHACRDVSGGRLHVSLAKGEQVNSIAVADIGDVANVKKSGGIGAAMISALSGQLHASTNVTLLPDGLKRFEIRLPNDRLEQDGVNLPEVNSSVIAALDQRVQSQPENL